MYPKKTTTLAKAPVSCSPTPQPIFVTISANRWSLRLEILEAKISTPNKAKKMGMAQTIDLSILLLPLWLWYRVIVMRARIVMTVSWAVTLWSCASEGPPATKSESDVAEKPMVSGPDLILITVESWRSDHLHSFGYERNTMPALEQRLDSARVYSRGIAPSSWTLPSMASIMTGLQPSTHGLIRPDVMLTGKVDTTAEMLLAKGMTRRSLESMLGFRTGIRFVSGL